MIRNILTNIGGIENFGLISIGLFFTFFLGMLVWAFGRKRSYLDAMSLLPLDDATPAGALTNALRGATAQPPGLGLRQSSGAVETTEASESSGGLPQSTTAVAPSLAASDSRSRCASTSEPRDLP